MKNIRKVLWDRKVKKAMLRPKKGSCPVCGVPENAWCKNYCSLLDPVDYR